MSTVDRSPEPDTDSAPIARVRSWVARTNDTDVAAVIGVGGIITAAVLSPAHIEDGPTLCMFRALTGLPCPGCGLTRSWVYLMHGDIGLAFERNPFGPVLVLAILVLAVFVARARIRGERPPRLENIARNRYAQVVFGAWLAFGLIRMLYVAFS